MGVGDTADDVAAELGLVLGFTEAGAVDDAEEEEVE